MGRLKCTVLDLFSSWHGECHLGSRLSCRPRCWTSSLIAPHGLPVCSTPGLRWHTSGVTKVCSHQRLVTENRFAFWQPPKIPELFNSMSYIIALKTSFLRHFLLLIFGTWQIQSSSWSFLRHCINVWDFDNRHTVVLGNGKAQTNKCLFIKAEVRCVIWLWCQKSIYHAEQGGRSRPGLKNWVSGRLSPSALSQLGMRVLHHPTRSVTSAGHMEGGGGKEQWGAVLSTSSFLVGRPGLLWFRLHANKEEILWHLRGHYNRPQ